jgi:ribosomal protein S17E
LLLRSLYDSSYVVAGCALSGINELDKDTAYTLSKKLLETKPKSTLESTIWVILGQTAKDDDIRLYEDKYKTLFGNQKYGYAYSLTAYEKHVKSDASYARGLDIFKYMAIVEESKQVRKAMFGYTLQLGKEQKENTKSEVKDEAAVASKRLEMVLKTLDMIISEETDKELVESYKKKRKSEFEEN